MSHRGRCICYFSDSGCHRSDIDKKNMKNEGKCGGHVIETLTLWTEVQCADSCLRLDFCDTYIFDQKESNLIGNCTLHGLSASVDHHNSASTTRNVNQHKYQGQSEICKTLRLVDGKVSTG